jgi:hypothetical protein
MGFLGEFCCFIQPVAGKSSDFELAQNRLAEKFKPMLKNRRFPVGPAERLFRINLEVW